MKSTAKLRRAILSRSASVTVLGQGYVGLSIACAAADGGFVVCGIDIDAVRVSDLGAGRLTVPGVAEEIYRTGVGTGRLGFTTDASAVGDADIVLVAVPTPLRDRTPDLAQVEAACADVARHMRPGSLVILESTTYPGTTAQIVRPILESGGLRAGSDFLLAYSPERIDPGNPEFGVRNTPRIVGGLTPEATGVAALFYEQIIEKVISVSSTRSAELAKLLENTFRHVNVALVNEMAMLCHDMGIDVWEVIDAAASKPFGFMAFQPGPGVGGHCIPLDPNYLAWQVRRDAGRQFRVLEEAEDINAQMPEYVARRIGDVLNDRGKPVRHAHVFVLGIAYKPDVGDARESPSLRVIEVLQRKGASVAFHDPYIESLPTNGSRVTRTDLTRRSLAASDCVALLTPHSLYDLDWIAENASVVFDARNAYGAARFLNVVRL
jgi:UDP-N-acetyl-D-glucosamine dehydrogenase